MAYYSANEAIEALKKLEESGTPITQEAVEAIVNNVSVVVSFFLLDTRKHPL